MNTTEQLLLLKMLQHLTVNWIVISHYRLVEGSVETDPQFEHTREALLVELGEQNIGNNQWLTVAVRHVEHPNFILRRALAIDKPVYHIKASRIAVPLSTTLH